MHSRRAVHDAAIDANAGRALLTASVGRSLTEAIELGRRAKDKGADALMAHQPLDPFAGAGRIFQGGRGCGGSSPDLLRASRRHERRGHSRRREPFERGRCQIRDDESDVVAVRVHSFEHECDAVVGLRSRRGLDKWIRVVLPASLPYVVSGMKQGWAFAWRSLMAAEIFVTILTGFGLGHLLHYGRELSAMDQVIGVMIVIVLIGLLADKVLFSPWEQFLHRRWGTEQLAQSTLRGRGDYCNQKVFGFERHSGTLPYWY